MSSLSALPSHWITKSILELQNEGILLVEDGNHGNDRPRKDEFTDNRDGICFIRAADIKDGAIKFDECSRINNTAFDRIRKGKSNPGDILITHKGTVGTLAFVPPSSSEKFVCSPQTTFYRVTDVETIDREFLYTFMRSHYFLDQFNMYAGETDMAPYVSLTNQRKLKISFPPLDEQKKIKHLISLLDKKISFLKQANKTIEQIAQTIFRSWFVDFDPVHAKKLAIDTGLSKDEAERAAMAIICGVCEPKEFFQSFEEIDKRLSDKLEKMSAEDRTKLSQIASLFPSEFEDSELGEIPKSWSVEKLGEHIEILDSKRVPLSKQEREKRKGKIPYYGATSVMGYVDEHIFDEELVLIGEDGSVMDKNGYPFMQYIWGKSWVNNHAHVLKGAGYFNNPHLYFFLKQTNVTAYVTGAVQLKINQGNLKSIKFVKCNDELASAYNNLSKSIIDGIMQGSDENSTLEILRDTLLPKLLSGEIDLSNIEISEAPKCPL